MAYINLLEIVYPIGSVYISTTETSPAEIIGGSWTKIEGATLRSCSKTDEIGYIGSDTHTLTVAEIPAHAHDLKTTVNGQQKIVSANLVSNSGYTWSNVFSGDDHLVYRSQISNSAGTNWMGGNEAHSIIQRSYNVYIYYRIS